MTAWLIAAGLALVALALRAYDLPGPSLWFDEANGALFAFEPLTEIPGILAEDSSPPLYYLVLHLWSRLFGEGEIVLRSLSVLLGCLLVAATWLWGRELLGWRAGLWAALFVAFSPLQIYHSGQARMYAALPLLALLVWRHLARWLEGGRWPQLALAALWTVIALLTHNFCWHLLPAGLLLVGLHRRRSGWTLPLVILGAFLLYLPWLPSFLHQLGNRDHYAWYEPLWRGYGLLDPLVYTLRSFSPGGEASMIGTHNVYRWGGWPTVVTCLIAAAGVVQGWRLRTALGPLRSRLCLVGFLVPLATALLASHLLTPHLVPGRVDQLLLVPFALLVGLGITLLPRLWLQLPLALFAPVLCLLTLPTFAPDPASTWLRYRGGDREAAAAIAADLRAKDLVVCTAYTNRSIEYYLRQAGHRPPLVVFPGRFPGLWYPEASWNEPGFREKLARRAAEVVAEIRRRLPPRGRLHLVVSHLKDKPYPRQLVEKLQKEAGLEVFREIGPFRQEGNGVPMTVLRGVLRR